MPAGDALREDQREQLVAQLEHLARLGGGESLMHAARRVTNEEVANSVGRLDFGSEREWNVSFHEGSMTNLVVT